MQPAYFNFQNPPQPLQPLPVAKKRPASPPAIIQVAKRAKIEEPEGKERPFRPEFFMRPLNKAKVVFDQYSDGLSKNASNLSDLPNILFTTRKSGENEIEPYCIETNVSNECTIAHISLFVKGKCYFFKDYHASIGKIVVCRTRINFGLPAYGVVPRFDHLKETFKEKIGLFQHKWNVTFVCNGSHYLYQLPVVLMNLASFALTLKTLVNTPTERTAFKDFLLTFDNEALCYGPETDETKSIQKLYEEWIKANTVSKITFMKMPEYSIQNGPKYTTLHCTCVHIWDHKIQKIQKFSGNQIVMLEDAKVFESEFASTRAILIFENSLHNYRGDIRLILENPAIMPNHINLPIVTEDAKVVIEDAIIPLTTQITAQNLNPFSLDPEYFNPVFQNQTITTEPEEFDFLV